MNARMEHLLKDIKAGYAKGFTPIDKAFICHLQGKVCCCGLTAAYLSGHDLPATLTTQQGMSDHRSDFCSDVRMNARLKYDMGWRETMSFMEGFDGDKHSERLAGDCQEAYECGRKARQLFVKQSEEEFVKL